MNLETGRPSHIYQRYPPGALLLKPDIRSMAILGMGSGGMGVYMRELMPELEVDYVEKQKCIVEYLDHLISEAGTRRLPGSCQSPVRL